MPTETLLCGWSICSPVLGPHFLLREKYAKFSCHYSFRYCFTGLQAVSCMHFQGQIIENILMTRSV
jgi:hypothetical protein